MKDVKWWILIALSLALAVKLGAGAWRLWKTGEVITEAQTELTDLKAKNQELQKKLSYVQSDEFVEKEARDKLGYGRTGETTLILPNQSTTQNSTLNVQKDTPNWRKWRELYLGF